MMTILFLLVVVSCCLTGLRLVLLRAETLSITQALLETESEQRLAPCSADLGCRAGKDALPILMGATLFAGLRAALCGFSMIPIGVAALLGVFAGRLYKARVKEVREKRALRRMEFYLPTVMERIVMAVGAGLDIVPALQEASRGAKDPVSKALSDVVKLSEGGTPVDAAFESVALRVRSISVRHALTHLALAHRQGGEIVRPLKELSDATQTAYQESVEEMISRLPVQAVLPLVVTFTGLIICFLTVPLMQVSSIATKVAHVAR